MLKSFEHYVARIQNPPADGCKKDALIREIYAAGLCRETQSLARLEYLGYLDKVLWTRLAEMCGATLSRELTLSIIAVLNETARCGRLSDVLAQLLQSHEPKDRKAESPFGCLFRTACLAAMDRDCALRDLESILQLLVHVYARLEHTPIRRVALRLTSLALWEHLPELRRNHEFREFPQLRQHWQHHIAKKMKRAPPFEANFFPFLIDTITRIVEAQTNEASGEEWSLRCIARFLELCTDLLLQLPTRRFLHLVMVDARILERITMSKRASHKHIAPLLTAFRRAMDFKIVDQTGQVPALDEELAKRRARIYGFQCTCFTAKPDDAYIREIAFIPSAHLASRTTLHEILLRLPDDTLVEVASNALAVLPHDVAASQPQLLVQALLNDLCDRSEMSLEANSVSLYPTEAVLWGEIPHETDWPLALPKLNLQFLTFHDYLLRSFALYRLESAHEIRADIARVIRRVQPQAATGGTGFTGWSRFAVSCSCEVTHVTKPPLGKLYPAEVLCQVTVDFAVFGERGLALRQEWEQLREHDVVFLLCLDLSPARVSPSPGISKSAGSNPGIRHLADDDEHFPKKYGIRAVRGGEIVEVTSGDTMTMCSPGESSIGSRRTFTLRMDPVQYHNDVQGSTAAVYGAMNLVLRREARANNFSRILGTIRDLINAESLVSAVPTWLRDVILGYGDASAAHYSKRGDQLDEFDAVDTFHDLQHIATSFRELSVVDAGKGFPMTKPATKRPLFRLCLDRVARRITATAYALKLIDSDQSPALRAQSRRIFDVLRCNPVRFTPSQVEAIRDGMNPGLTLVVGPPGTGKTDVAVQIVANLHRNFPAERTLLVAHSNAALNDLFEKILQRDVPARHLVRLGTGERELDVGGSFSQLGRVDAMLARRLLLLDEVQRLAAVLHGRSGTVQLAGYTCEAAEHFERAHVDVRISAFEQRISGLGRAATISAIQEAFPFTDFFCEDADARADLPMEKNLFGTCQTVADAVVVSRSSFKHIRDIFAELREYRAFELLRTQKQRMNYLLTKQARIVAMTCTHASLVRRDLVDLGFSYDTIVVEEAAQMLEIEAFIPFLLQNGRGNETGLKRVVLIGDHQQLPPVVQNCAISRHALLDQSLFARLLRLGAPAVHLDKQGRCRPEIAELYNWRYRSLGNLKLVFEGSYKYANPGFSFPYQFVDVADFQGRGEHCPTPHFFQNLGEAEYVAAVYMYMRLLGYPAARITVLTTYNGQKALLKDVLERRCAVSARFGLPGVIDTVDKYQGSQNDYVLLSLVRTKHVGHLRDVRRLVVATSRARLGLYVFGRASIFQACNDLTPTMNHFLKRPTHLSLACGEIFRDSDRKLHETPASPAFIEGPAEMGVFVRGLGIGVD